MNIGSLSPRRKTHRRERLYVRQQKLCIRIAFILRCLIVCSIVFVYYLRHFHLAVTNININNGHVAHIQQNSAVVLNTTAAKIFTEYKQHGRRLLYSLSSTVPNYTNNTNATNDDDVNCSKPAILDFPWDGLTRLQRQQGWVLVHMLIALYLFWLLATICDEYFVPAVGKICESLNMTADVVGATFMAMATASPELFMNCIGTFVTHSDIGMGTIVGSAVFNVLAVPAFSGILLQQRMPLNRWSVSRDCLMYGLAVLALFFILLDGRIMWYEALVLVLGYCAYLLLMFNNDKLLAAVSFIRANYCCCKRRAAYREVNELSPMLQECMHTLKDARSLPAKVDTDIERISMHSLDMDYALTPWAKPAHLHLFLHILHWPITLLLWLTLPDSRRHARCKYLTLFSCILWIGLISYLVAYTVTIIGDTLNIPDSVLGLTILAAGMSVPEAISSILMTSQGHGAMGISNALGSNTADILLCLGLPWLVKAYFLPTTPNERWIVLNSDELIYATVFLLTSLLGLYMAIVLNRFALNWTVGVSCLCLYLAFLLIALNNAMNTTHFGC